jgi:hypothetical protein
MGDDGVESEEWGMSSSEGGSITVPMSLMWNVNVPIVRLNPSGGVGGDFGERG